MPPIAQPPVDQPPSAARRGKSLTTLLLVVLAVALLAFQLGDIATLPMQAWDESRLAVNAIEMVMTGERIVTTYGFQPDLWNTKPPLVINLMAWSMQLFGTSFFAMRLPSALAACATVFLVVAVVRRITGSLGCAVAAGILLATAQNFYGYHGGQTGDYDAPLTLLTTGYAVVLFDMIEGRRTRWWQALAAGSLVGLAILAKGIAGVIPGVGVAVFAVVFAAPRLRANLVNYLVVVVVGVAIGAGFYLLRSAGPGDYLAAVSANELGGRFDSAVDQHASDRWFYLRELTRRIPGIFAPLLIGLIWVPRGPTRRLSIFALCVAGGVFLVFSAAATKLSWYSVPAMPFVAIALACGGLGIFRRIERFGKSALTTAARLIVCAALVAIPVKATRLRYGNPWKPHTAPRDFVALVAAARSRAMVPLVVVDTGFDNSAALQHYAPTLRFTALVASRENIGISQATDVAAAETAPFLGSCDPAVRSQLAEIGDEVWSNGDCVLVRR